MTSQPLISVLPWQDRQSARWEVFLAEQAPHNFLQSWTWGEFKQLLGKKVLRYGVTQGSELLGVAQIVIESTPVLGETAYLSRGPILSAVGQPFAADILTHLARQLQRQGVARFLLEPAPEMKAETTADHPDWLDSSWQPTTSVQPHRSLVLDINRSDDTLLDSFKPKTRYNIRLGERKGVQITASEDRSALPTLLALLRETESRQRISLYNADYFGTLFDTYSPTGQIHILEAQVDQTPIAALLLLFQGSTAYYLFGGTSNARRELMANYLLHFEAQKFSREKSMTQYDFWGIALPEDGNYEAWQGITRFKLGFGGEVISYPIAYQKVFKKVRYSLYHGLKRLRP